MRPFEIYLPVFSLIAICILGGVSGFNALVDPYGMLGSPLYQGFNVVKPEQGRDEPAYKIHRVTQIRPRGLILGASNSDIGLDPRHKGWDVKPVYNFSIGRNSISTAYLFLLHAAASEMPRQIILSIDLAMFNSAHQDVFGIDKASLIVTETGEKNPDYSLANIYATVFSIDMLKSSVRTVIANYRENLAQGEYEPLIGDYGLMNPDRFTIGKWWTYRSLFLGRVTEQVQKFWAPVDQMKAIDNWPDSTAFDAYRNVLRMACEQNIDLRIVISPSHAYMYEATRLAGLWPVWEQWKRAIVQVTASESGKYGCAPFPVWDFSNYDDTATEVIAVSNSPDKASRWYLDAVHYRKQLGDKMLDRVFAANGSVGSDLPGVRLDQVDLDEHFTNIRKLAEFYRTEHAEEVAIVADTVSAAMQMEPTDAGQN